MLIIWTPFFTLLTDRFVCDSYSFRYFTESLLFKDLFLKREPEPWIPKWIAKASMAQYVQIPLSSTSSLSLSCATFALRRKKTRRLPIEASK